MTNFVPPWGARAQTIMDLRTLIDNTPLPMVERKDGSIDLSASHKKWLDYTRAWRDALSALENEDESE